MSKSSMGRPLALASVSVIVAMALALTGCQSAVDAEPSEPDQPVSGGTLTIAQATDIQPNNLLATRLGNSGWAANVFETVTAYDANGEPAPLLATDWTVADDGLAITLSLRDDVTFHTGRTMTAEDVKFSFEYLIQSPSQVAFIGDTFAGIEVLSETELRIDFTAPTPTIFDFFEYAFILDSETIDGVAEGSEIIGTGPFLFESWAPGSSVSLVRNDEYWGEPAHLDGIEIAIISDSTAMLNAVRSNRSQAAIGMSPIDIQSFSSNPDFEVIRTSGSVYPLGIDVTQPPFDQKAARQAVHYAIDRERIAAQIFGDAGVVSPLFWEATTPGFPEDLVDHYTYDPEKAQQMLADAGAAGAELTISVISLPQTTSVAEIVRNNLEAVGLKPTINVVENQTFGQNQIAGDLGPAFIPVHGLSGLSPISLLSTLPSLRQGNPSKYWSAEYEDARAALATAAPGQEYADALHDLSVLILDEAFTSVVVQAVGQTVITTDAIDAGWTRRGYLDAKSMYLNQ